MVSDADGVAVRAARTEDERDCRRACIDFDPGTADLSREVFHRRFQALVGRADYCLPLASFSDRVVGYALAQDFGPNLRLRFTIGRIHDLFVAPEWRHHGVGRLLMQHVFAWARQRPEAMILDWQASRDAVGFYQALGFQADRIGDYRDYPAFSLDLRNLPAHDR